MEKFRKIVAVEDVLLSPEADERLHEFAREVELYRDMPAQRHLDARSRRQIRSKYSETFP